MRQLFHQLVRPMATGETIGAFLNRLRIVVIDGTCFDVPDMGLFLKNGAGSIHTDNAIGSNKHAKQSLFIFLNGISSDENARVFGRPSSRPGTQAAFPKVRLVILVEAGTHIIFDAIRVSIPHRRTSSSIKIITLCTIRNVVDVG